jgi:hypothetical protein
LLNVVMGGCLLSVDLTTHKNSMETGKEIYWIWLVKKELSQVYLNLVWSVNGV